MTRNLFQQTGFFADKIELKYLPDGTPKIRQKVFFNDNEYQGKNDPNKGKISFEATVEYLGDLATRIFNYAKQHQIEEDGVKVNSYGRKMPIYHVGILETKKFKGDDGKEVKYNLLHGKHWRVTPVHCVGFSVTFTDTIQPEYKEKEGEEQKEMYIDAKVYHNQKIYEDDKKNRSLGPFQTRVRGRSAKFLKDAAERDVREENGMEVKTFGKGMTLDAVAIMMQDNWTNQDGQLIFSQRLEIVELTYPRFNFNSFNKNQNRSQYNNSNQQPKPNQQNNAPKYEKPNPPQPKVEEKKTPEIDIDINDTSFLDQNITIDDDPFGFDNDKDLGLGFSDDDPLSLEDDVKHSLSK